MNRLDSWECRTVLGAWFLLVAVGGCDIQPDYSSGTSGGCGAGVGDGRATLHVRGCPDPQSDGSVWVASLSRIEASSVDVPIRVRTTADSVRAFGFSLSFPPELGFRGVVPSVQTRGWSLDHAVGSGTVLVTGAMADSSAAPVGGHGILAFVQFRVIAGGSGRAFALASLRDDIAEYEACPVAP